MTHLKFGRTAKIVFSLLLAIAVAGSILLYNQSKEPVVGDVPSVSQGLVPTDGDGVNPLIRPTSQPDWHLDDVDEEKKNYPFMIGTGLKDSEAKPATISKDYWQEVFLPEINQPSIWAGNTFILTGEGINPDQNLKAWIFPYDTHKDDEKSFMVEVTPNTDTRDTRYNVPIPSNLSEGAYTLRVQTYEDILFLDFLVVPYGATHPLD